jgi:asparagine synthase (glutamine-hydrolysing)
MGAIVAVINKIGENATKHAAAMLKILSHKGVETFGLASPHTLKIEDTIEKLRSFNVNSPTVVGYAFSRITAVDKPQPVKLENATFAFEGRIYPTHTENSDAEVFAKKIRDNPAGEVEKFLKEADGGFAFVIAEQERLIAGRDSVGICPLYFGENELLMALASERKALWKIGIEKTHSFPPGTLLIADKKGFKFSRVRELAREKISNVTVQSASGELKALLQSSVEEKVAGLEEVAVAFSGGLDSSLIAFLAKKAGTSVRLIHVSLKNQPETAHAIKVAEELKLPIHVYTYTADDVKEALPKALWLIEEPDPVKVSIGVPICWVAEKTAEMGIKALLAGQGADELFGGYKRYAVAYATHGEKKVEEMLFSDVLTVHETNLERDYKICNFHNVELRLPYLTYKLANFAANLPLKLKLKLPDDGMRKLVLRAAAKKLGLPKAVLERPKRAMQYATGVDKTLKKLAENENLSTRDYLKRSFQSVFERMVRDG